jgi:AcrR family transcriptional regulator
VARKKNNYHVGNLQELLIERGIEILRREGPEGLSLRKVAGAAGVTHTAAYRHFDDKDALLAAIAGEGFDLLYEYQCRVVAECGDDLLARFINLGWLYVRFTIEHPEHARIMFGGGGFDFRAYPELSAAAAKTFRQLLDVIRRGQAAGLIAAGGSKHRALAAWSMVHGVAMLILDGQIHLRGDLQATEQLIKSVIGNLYSGMAPART